MTRTGFEFIIYCLHIINPSTYEANKRNPFYDNINKIKWLVEESRIKFRNNYNLAKILTIDKMILRYKGKFYLIRQYISNKPVKWGDQNLV